MTGIEAAFTGRVGKPPEARTSAKGTAWKSLSLAVEGSSEAAEWVSVSAFGEVADELPDDLAAGERCYCEGKLRLNKWSGKDGSERSNLQVTASKIVVLNRIGRKRRKAQRRFDAPSEGDVAAAKSSATRRAEFNDPVPF